MGVRGVCMGEGCRVWGVVCGVRVVWGVWYGVLGERCKVCVWVRVRRLYYIYYNII